MMAAHGIPVSAQEMIIRRRKDRFIADIVPNVPPETRRRPPCSSCGHRVTRYLPNIAGAASTAASISYIKKLLLLKQRSSSSSSSISSSSISSSSISSSRALILLLHLYLLAFCKNFSKLNIIFFFNNSISFSSALQYSV